MAPIASIGKILPVSLLAHITEIRMVSGVIGRFELAKIETPSLSTGR